jgi:hypothetical protein
VTTIKQYAKTVDAQCARRTAAPARIVLSGTERVYVGQHLMGHTVTLLAGHSVIGVPGELGREEAVALARSGNSHCFAYIVRRR